jgi:hypothetical protein
MNTIPVKDLMASQFSNGETFRYDIIVKYMAIEDLDKGGDYGIDAYIRMYTLFKGNKVERRMNTMRKMLQEFDTSNHPITINDKNHIRNGSHRLAMACYLDVTEIHYVNTRRRGGETSRNKISKVFSDEELHFIDCQKIKILNKIGLA